MPTHFYELLDHCNRSWGYITSCYENPRAIRELVILPLRKKYSQMRVCKSQIFDSQSAQVIPTDESEKS